MTQEYTSAKIPSDVRTANPVPVDLAGEDVDSIREKIVSGKAFLKVVAYPWGVEFDVCEAEGSR
jgi:hypothetical protein